MSNTPRWYRRQHLTKKLFTGDPMKDGLMDQQDAANRRKAIEAKLDQQDREYQRRQNKQVNKYLERL